MIVYLVLDATGYPVNAYYKKESAIAYAEKHPGHTLLMISVNK